MSNPNAIRTWLTERLGLRYPIIQAPMAGGPTTPELVAAVFAFAKRGNRVLTDEEILQVVKETRAK